jgi:predicted transposase YbfD/YdcC
LTHNQPLDEWQQCQRSRGRIEQRRVVVYAPLAGFDADWPGLHRFIHVERTRRHQGTLTRTQSFYISSRKETSAAFFADGLRRHWSIENRLHYVKDVGQNEDKNRIAHPVAALNVALLKTVALNLVRASGYASLKKATLTLANKLDQLLQLIRT